MVAGHGIGVNPVFGESKQATFQGGLGTKADAMQQADTWCTIDAMAARDNVVHKYRLAGEEE